MTAALRTTPPHEQPPAEGPARVRAAALRDQLPALETERTRLRAPSLADFPAWAAILCSPRAAFMDGPFPRDAAFREFTATIGLWLLRGHGVWTVESRSGGAPLGFVLIGFEPGDREPELGFFVTEAAEGSGFAQEAAAVARDWAFAQGLPSLVSYIDPANSRSIRIAERLGGVADPVPPGSEGDPESLVYRYRPEAEA